MILVLSGKGGVGQSTVNDTDSKESSQQRKEQGNLKSLRSVDLWFTLRTTLKTTFTGIKSLIHTQGKGLGGLILIGRFSMFRISLVFVLYIWERDLLSEYLQ